MTKPDTNKALRKLPIKKNPYILVAAILVLVVILTLSGRRSYDDTYDAYIEATMDCDAEAVVDLLHDSYISNLIARGEVDSKDDLIQRVQNKLDWYTQCAKEKEGGAYEYIAELQSVKDENMDDEIPYHLEFIYGDSAGKLKKAKVVYIYYNLVDSNGRVASTLTDDLIYFVKIGQKWYLGEISRYDQFNW